MAHSSKTQPTSASGTRRIGLVGCVKEKTASATQAGHLYTSALFTGRRCYVEHSCDEWWILSAAHGLVHPDIVLAPYDVTLTKVSRAERRRWSAAVLQSAVAAIHPRPRDIFEIHAGAEYRDFGLVEGLLGIGCSVEIPTHGMPIGQQLRFYRQSRVVPP